MWWAVHDVQEFALREAAEKEKILYKSVILVDELHQSYKEDNQEQEDGKKADSKVAQLSADDMSNAEATRLLQDAVTNKRETLDLSNQSLSHLPDSIGQIVTLVSLNLSNNRLQVRNSALSTSPTRIIFLNSGIWPFHNCLGESFRKLS